MASDKSAVTICTEQSPDFSRVMIVVNGESRFEFSLSPSTNRAASSLLLQKLFVLFMSYPVFTKEIVVSGCSHKLVSQLLRKSLVFQQLNAEE